MKFLLRHQHSLFLVVIGISAVIFGWRAVQLTPLYLSGQTRNRVQAALTRAADREGWLLSDLDLQSVSDSEIIVIHREHRRGADPEHCLVIRLSDSSLRPCDTGNH